MIYKLETQTIGQRIWTICLNPIISHGRAVIWTYLHLAHDLDHQNWFSWRLRSILGKKKKGGNLGEQEWPMFQTTFGKLAKSSQIWASHYMKIATRPIESFGLTHWLKFRSNQRYFRLNFKIDMFCFLFCMIVILCWKEWFTCIKKWPVIGLLSEIYLKSYSKPRQVILKVLKTWAQVQYYLCVQFHLPCLQQMFLWGIFLNNEWSYFNWVLMWWVPGEKFNWNAVTRFFCFTDKRCHVLLIPAIWRVNW